MNLLDKKDVLANSPSSNSDYVEVPLTVKRKASDSWRHSCKIKFHTIP